MVLQILLGTMYTKDGLVHADRLHHAVAYGMVPVLVGLLLDDVEDVQDIDELLNAGFINQKLEAEAKKARRVL